MLFGHDTFNVFKNNDGVVNNKTNSQNEAEQGQGVDGEAKHVHAGKGTNNGYWHGKARNERCTPVLQKQVNNNKYQEHSFEQSVDNFFDGNFNELGGVVRNFVVHAFREGLLQAVHSCNNEVRGIQSVCTRRQENANRYNRLAIKFAKEVVVKSAKFNAGNVSKL